MMYRIKSLYDNKVFKDTGNTQETANVVIALMNPKRYNLNNYLEYDLTTSSIINGKHIKNTDFFRAAFVLKNRGGRDNVKVAFRFLGSCGHFEEIPVSDDFIANPRWYTKFADFSKPFLEHIKTIK